MSSPSNGTTSAGRQSPNVAGAHVTLYSGPFTRETGEAAAAAHAADDSGEPPVAQLSRPSTFEIHRVQLARTATRTMPPRLNRGSFEVMLMTPPDALAP